MDVSYCQEGEGRGWVCVWEAVGGVRGTWGREAASMFVILNVRQKPEKSSHPDVFEISRCLASSRPRSLLVPSRPKRHSTFRL